ncbi:MAG: hypothetical protein DWQ19_12960 [Crenarchaeota archaeon]|nr:MAG: hypothetical protein DWQ19_12960 [Thermoproteota archaeon]
MRKIIFILLVLVAKPAFAQYYNRSNSTAAYVNGLARQAQWHAMVNTARINHFRYGNNYGYQNARRQRPKHSAAQLWKKKQENLKAKQSYREAQLEAAQQRLRLTQLRYEMKLREERYREQGVLPELNPSFGFNGKRYPSYDSFLATPEGRAWKASLVVQ